MQWKQSGVLIKESILCARYQTGHKGLSPLFI